MMNMYHDHVGSYSQLNAYLILPLMVVIVLSTWSSFSQESLSVVDAGILLVLREFFPEVGIWDELTSSCVVSCGSPGNTPQRLAFGMS